MLALAHEIWVGPEEVLSRRSTPRRSALLLPRLALLGFVLVIGSNSQRESAMLLGVVAWHSLVESADFVLLLASLPAGLLGPGRAAS